MNSELITDHGHAIQIALELRVRQLRKDLEGCRDMTGHGRRALRRAKAALAAVNRAIEEAAAAVEPR